MRDLWFEFEVPFAIASACNMWQYLGHLGLCRQREFFGLVYLLRMLLLIEFSRVLSVSAQLVTDVNDDFIFSDVVCLLFCLNILHLDWSRWLGYWHWHWWRDKFVNDPCFFYMDRVKPVIIRVQNNLLLLVLFSPLLGFLKRLITL